VITCGIAMAGVEWRDNVKGVIIQERKERKE
jgi:hypothetical protein